MSEFFCFVFIREPEPVVLSLYGYIFLLSLRAFANTRKYGAYICPFPRTCQANVGWEIFVLEPRTLNFAKNFWRRLWEFFFSAWRSPVLLPRHPHYLWRWRPGRGYECSLNPSFGSGDVRSFVGVSGYQDSG